MTSKEFSALAAKLAAGAVGVISIQEFVESLVVDRRKAIASLLGGGLASSLELISTMQHVKAWDAEFVQEHDTAVWDLYAAWWRVSVETQPALAAEERARLIDGLLAPVRNVETNSQARLVLIVTQFQMLLMLSIAPLLAAERQDEVAR